MEPTILIRFLKETDYKGKRRVPGEEMEVGEKDFADLIDKNIDVERVDESKLNPPPPPAPPTPPTPPATPAVNPPSAPVPVAKPEKSWVGGHTVPA